MLNFQPVTLGMKELVESYTFKYGEGSCQHSFVSSYSLKHKYGDRFCEYEGFLYTMRSLKCSDSGTPYRMLLMTLTHTLRNSNFY